MTSLVLPTTPRARPAPSIDRDTFQLIGPPKAGKTTGALSFPNCLLIDCERGARKYGGLVVDVLEEAEKAGTGPISVLRSLYAQLSKDCQYGAVAIDTVDALSRWFEAEAVHSMNEKHGRGKNNKPLYTNIADIDYGAGHAEHRAKVMAMLEAYVRLPCIKILIAHSKTMISDEVGTQVKVADLPGKLGHWVPAVCDHIGMVRMDPKRGPLVEWSGYEVQTQKGFSIQQAGSRLSELNGKTMPLTYDAIMAELNGAA